MKIDLAEPNVGGFQFEFLRLLSAQSVGAAEIGECIYTMGRIAEDDFDGWVDEWSGTADRVAADAQRLVSAGNTASARDAFLRAANYYRAAEFYATQDDPRQIAAWRSSRECFAQAAPMLRFPPEPIEVAFDGARLPGYFVCGGQEDAPTLIAMSGFDGSAEEVYYWIGPAAAERGWNCAIFEGPGQRGALHVNPGLVLRPDYEAPVGAVIDYLLGRPEVDPTRLALIGYSLGGFLATRAATFEPRVKAVIADSLIVDVGAAFGAMWPRVLRASPPRVVDTAFNLLARLRPDTQWGMDHARWTMGIAHPRDFFAAWAPFTLRGTEEAMTVPLLCLLGEDEIAQTSAEVITETVQYLKAVRARTNIAYFPKETGASSHCQMGGLSYATAAIFTWLQSIMGADPWKSETHPFHMPEDAVAAVRRHHPGLVLE